MSAQGKAWYAEQCRKPAWQKKRLQILERAGWKCQYCKAEDQTLAIHHRYYVKGRAPWEYPDFALVAVCEDCHAGQRAFEKENVPLSGRFMDVMFSPLGDEAILDIVLCTVGTQGMTKKKLAEAWKLFLDHLDPSGQKYSFDVDMGYLP